MDAEAWAIHSIIADAQQEEWEVARFNKGWVKAWRDTLDNDLPDNIWLWGIWHWLLLTATWKPTKIIWNGEPREVPPGTVVMGMLELSNKWKCSINTIKKWLLYLEKSERIYIERCTRGTLVTLRDWDLFQNRDEDECTPNENEVKTECKPSENEVQLSKESKNKELKKEEINTGASENFQAPPSGTDANAPVILDTQLSLGNNSETKVSVPKKSKFSDTTRFKMRAFLAAYSQGWKEKYKSQPEGIRDKALIGKLGHWIEHVSQERAVQLVEVYLQISHKPFADSYHDLWQFFRHLNRIGVALDSGKDSNETDWDYVFGRTV